MSTQPFVLGEERDLPLVRLRRRWFRTNVVAFYETGVLIGTAIIAHPQITEEMLRPDGMALLRSRLSLSRFVPYEEIAAVRETGRINGKVGGMVLWTGYNKLSIKRRRGRKAVALVKGSEMTNVTRLLIAKVGGTYVKKALKQTAWWKALMLKLMAVVAAIAGVFAPFVLPQSLLSNPVVPLVWVQVGMVFAGVAFAYGIYLSRWHWIKASELPPLPRRKVSRPTGASSPLRSTVMGWVLKLLALAYWLVLAEHWHAKVLGSLAETSLIRNQQLVAAIGFLFMLPVVLLIHTGYRLSQARHNPKATADSRRPIVFLRPFEDDSKASLQPVGTVAALSGVRDQWNLNVEGMRTQGRMTFMDLLVNSHPVRLLRMLVNRGVDSSEEALVRYFEKVGPMVAIGRPGERLQVPGAARVYVADDEWRDAVMQELEHAQIILVQPGTSRGVQWELAYMRSFCEPTRLLMCLAGYWGRPEAYEDLVAQVRATMRVELPRVVPFLRSPAFIYFNDFWLPQLQEMSFKNPVLWPLTGSGADLEYSLQPFLQGAHGGQREMPRPARWTHGFATGLAKSVAAVLGFSIMIAVALGMESAGDRVRGWMGLESRAKEEETVRQGVSRLLRESKRKVVKGKAVPYQISVPDSLLARSMDEPMHEHVYVSTDGRFSIMLVAHAGEESVFNLAEQRVNLFTGAGFENVRMEATRSVDLADTAWTESRLTMISKDGVPMREVAYAHSSSRGTVLALVQMANPSGENDPDLEVAYEILNSLRLGR